MDLALFVAHRSHNGSGHGCRVLTISRAVPGSLTGRLLSGLLKLGRRVAWANHAHPHTGPPQFSPKRFSDRHLRKFGGAIAGCIGKRLLPNDAADQNNMSLLLFHEMRYGGMNRFVTGLKVDLPDASHVLWRDFLKGPVDSVTCVTNEQVQTSQFFKALLDNGRSLARDAEIASFKDHPGNTFFEASFSHLGQPLFPARH